jgi:hypothetical protein
MSAPTPSASWAERRGGAILVAAPRLRSDTHMRSPDPGREQIILNAGRLLEKLGYGYLGDAHTLGAAWFTLRMKGIGFRFALDENGGPSYICDTYETSGAREGSLAWAWAYAYAPAKHPTERRVNGRVVSLQRVFALALEREIASAAADPAPFSQAKLERVYYAVPTARRGRPSKRPDPALLLEACRKRRLEILWERFLSPNEVGQLEQFATGASDRELAARWGIKEVSVRSRRSRLGAKLQQIVIQCTTALEEDMDREAVIAAVHEENEKTRSEIIAAIFKARDGETPSEAAERILAEANEEES